MAMLAEVDPASYTPTVHDVAALLRAHTKHSHAMEVGTSTTTPARRARKC